MVLTKRIIPCLDVANGRVVKGLNFESIKDAGDPVQLAEKYSNEGADELVFLDITASSEQRETIKSLVKKIAEVIDIPFTVGGGVKSLQHARDILLNGADKVAINTAAIKFPDVVTQVSRRFGSQCMVLSIQAKRQKNGWEAYFDNGREHSGLDVVEWAKEGEALGAGEILLTSMDRDGTKIGSDLTLTRSVSDAVEVPLIASGGVGTLEHLVEGIRDGKASAVLAASIFHFGEFTVAEAKQALATAGIPARL